MNPTKTEKTGKSKWQTTREPNLLKNADSGRYYARFVIGKKQRWINLETDVFTVARLRISDKRAEIERSRLASANVASGLGTFGELAAIYQAQIDADARISTRFIRFTKTGRVGGKFVVKNSPLRTPPRLRLSEVRRAWSALGP